MGILGCINNFFTEEKYLCAVCGEMFDYDDLYDEVITGHTGICLECIGSLPWVGTSMKFYSQFDPQTEIFAPLYYRGEVRRLIHQFKFEGMHAYARVLAYIIHYRLDEPHIDIASKYDMIVPVPLSEQRMHERGYNQSALIAKELAGYFGIEYCETALTRTKNTLKQSLMDGKKGRYENVRGAFEANADYVKEKRVLVFDDIYTYGYTMNECTKEIKTAGAVSTGAIVAALAISGGQILI